MILTNSDKLCYRWTRQEITLCNPTDETVEVMPKVSNTNNFVMDRDTEKPIILKPNINTSVTFRFVPSALGVGDHVAKIAFISEQVRQPEGGSCVYSCLELSCCCCC